MAFNPDLVPEIGRDGLPREAPVIAYTEKIIAEEQLQLRKYIEERYSEIRNVERELANLTMEMKLTAGPKRAALELLRQKIEAATLKISAAKMKEEQARKVWETASKEVKDEETVKKKLCEDLNRLVQESSNRQFARLEELRQRLEALNPNRASTPPPPDVVAVVSAQNSKPPDISLGPCSNEPSISHGNGEQVSAANGNSQRPAVEGEGRSKNKANSHVKGKGTGAAPKSKSPSAGWTGAGFDVDRRA